MTFEAKIKTKFGELIIHFNNIYELQSRLAETEELVKAIEVGTVNFTLPETPKTSKLKISRRKRKRV